MFSSKFTKYIQTISFLLSTVLLKITRGQEVTLPPIIPDPRHNLDTSITEEQRLLQTLLFQYDSASRPTFNASQSVQVRFQLTLVQISQLDEVNQVLTTNVWLEQEWMDERLLWDPRNFSGLHTIRIPCNKLWLPDIVLYNSADDFTSGYMQSKAMVRNDGRVFWPPPAKLRSTCKIDITYFPFDDQSCKMKFGSWTYDGFQVNVTKRHDDVDRSNYVHSGEWDLIRVEVVRNEVGYPCCPELYPDITFTIVMRRRTLYYLFNIIFPCLWLTVLSLLGFCLPPDSGEKITLGITVLLAFSVFMLLIAENMPATSEFVPLIGIYLTVTMATTSLSIVLTVVVLHLHHIGPNHHKVPILVKSLFFDTIAKILCMDTVSRYQNRNRLRKSRYNRANTTSNTYVFNSQQQQQQQEEASNNQSNSFQMTSLTPANPMVFQPCLQPGPCNGGSRICNPKSAGLPLQSFPSLMTHTPNSPAGKEIRSGSRASRGSVSLDPLQQEQYRMIMRHLSNLIEKQEEEEVTQEAINDWRMLAYVVDRMLFWLFLIAATLSTVVILVIMPLFKKKI